MPKEPLVPHWASECGRAVVYLGGNLDVMGGMDHNQFHAVVTDPPYGTEFMGKEWDAPWKGGVDARRRRADEMDDPIKAKYLQYNVEYNRDVKLYQQWFLPRAEAMLRVARPGAHLLSFGGTRMWHRAACAIEDAGWEVRDTIMWAYGSGFPKGSDISKGIDKIYGVERDKVGQTRGRRGDGTVYDIRHSGQLTSNEPVTEDAKRWSGWNTALKPSYEPILLARKKPIGSVAQNVLDYECGGINVDGCRVGVEGGCKRDESLPRTPRTRGNVLSGSVDGTLDGNRSPQVDGLGRWPANLIYDGSEEVVELFPVATRFFYAAKADKDDRPHAYTAAHPTAKPLDLMCYLVRLVCPVGGTVFDPFMGSGSTGCAAIAEGMWFVGIEQSQEYADMAVDRLKEMLGTHQAVGRSLTGRRVVKDVPPPPRKMR